MLTKIAAVAAAATGVLDALVLLHVLALSTEQIAGISGAIVLVGAAVHSFFNPDLPLGPKA